jgi:TRAP-type C4-dicarboxylate transport system permease small subunit
MRMAPLTPFAKTGHEVLFYVGAGGLLTVMLIEAIAVIGRHTGIPVLGALEIAQAAIVPAACASMVIASLHGSHATVSLILDRLSPARRAFLERFCALLSSLFLAVLFIGACWLARDFWDSHEHSEVLQIPFRPLRILTAASAGALALIFLRTRVRPGHAP